MFIYTSTYCILLSACHYTPGTVLGPGAIIRNKNGKVLVLSFCGVSSPEEKFVQSFHVV